MIALYYIYIASLILAAVCIPVGIIEYLFI